MEVPLAMDFRQPATELFFQTNNGCGNQRVNGLFQPVVKSKAGQTEIWVLANISDVAYMNVELTETATGRHPQIAIVGQDGNPFPAVHYPGTDNGTRLVIPPATRY